MRIKALAAGLILSWASASFAQAPPPAPPAYKFELHGFVGASMTVQDAVFNEWGQKAWYVTKTPNTDRLALSGDIRQTRLNFSVTGPMKVFGATPKAVTEVDFFAVANSAGGGQGGFGDVNQLLRFRLGYLQLEWADTTFIFGQMHDLIIPMIPASVGHIANPLTYAAGQIGFRRPGVTLYHRIPVGGMKLELAGQVKQGEAVQGSDPTLAPNLSLATASGLPSVEARVRLLSKNLTFYVAGHWHQYDRNGVGDLNSVPAARGSTQETVAGTAGVQILAGPLTVQGSGYIGKNVGPLIAFGGSLQTPAGAGDLHEWGAWGQVGFNVTKEFSAWFFAGTDHPDYADVIAIFSPTAAAPRNLQNVTTSVMLRYAVQGVTFAVEATHFHTKYTSAPAGSEVASPNGVLDGNQVMLSGMYFF